MPTKKPRKAGRPAEIDRGSLLDAAETLFAEKGFAGTTTREVVKRAGCNLALISYYFGGKEGLYQAVLVRYFESLKTRFAEMDFSEATLKRQWPELKDPVQRLLCATYFEFAQKITSESPLQKILCREMMTGPDKMIAALMQSEGGAFKLLSERLREMQKQGKLRPELDLRLGVVSLMGPVVYSSIAGPLLIAAYGFSRLDYDYVRGLCLHQTRMFFEGWGRK